MLCFAVFFSLVLKKVEEEEVYENLQFVKADTNLGKTYLFIYLFIVSFFTGTRSLNKHLNVPANFLLHTLDRHNNSYQRHRKYTKSGQHYFNQERQVDGGKIMVYHSRYCK